VQNPAAPYFLFATHETEHQVEYQAGWSIPDIFCPGGDPAPGVITCHDEFAIAWSSDEAVDNVERLLATRDEDEARRRYRLCAQKQWNYSAAKQALAHDGWRLQLTPILYRPFDIRWTIYNRHVAVHLRKRVTRQMLAGDNLALLIGKAGQVINQQAWDIVFCTRRISEFNLFRRGGNNLFPLYLTADIDSGEATRRVNLAPAFISELCQRLELRWSDCDSGDLHGTIGPRDIFSYIYAILHSTSYRTRYAAFLRRDFPRIPLVSSRGLLRALCHLGEKLIRLHLEEEEIQPVTIYPVAGENRVEAVSYVSCERDERRGRVWINAAQYFEDVPQAAWSFHIGGYQVCRKWLKDRKGRALSVEEIAHYQRIVAILARTTALMQEIDKAIEDAGGWSENI
jgi:predicted helicase